jgi:hypothetical protein
MPSFLTVSGQKITLRMYGNKTFLLSIVETNGEAKNIEMDIGNITALSAILNSLVFEHNDI